MTHTTPPVSGENLLDDDEEDVILLTDEIPPAERDGMTEICQPSIRSEAGQVPNLSASAIEQPAIMDLADVIEASDIHTELAPDFSVSEADILDFDLQGPGAPDVFRPEPEEAAIEVIQAPDDLHQEAGSQSKDHAPDDLQRLINEVIHDSQAPSQDFSGFSHEITSRDDSFEGKNDLSLLSPDRLDAAVERVIRSLFAERIEKILDDAFAATVTLEIKNVKTILLDQLTSGKTDENIQP
jgi:hypothetical protein